MSWIKNPKIWNPPSKGWITKLKGMLFRDNSRLHKRFITFLDDNNCLLEYLTLVTQRGDYDVNKPLTDFLSVIDNKSKFINRSGIDCKTGYWYLKVFVWEDELWSDLHDKWEKML